MAKKISLYPNDADPSVHDKLLGTDSGSSKTTLNYRVGDTLALLDNTFATIQLTYRFYTDGSADETNLGVFTTDSDTIASITEIYINQYNINSDDITSLMTSIDSILPTYDVFLKIKDTTDSELYGYFKVGAIIDNTGNFTIQGSIQGGVANGDFVNGSYYFLETFFYVIQTSQPASVQQVTWTEFKAYTPKNNGDRFQITTASEAEYGGHTFGFVTMISNTQFFWENGDQDIETIIILAP